MMSLLLVACSTQCDQSIRFLGQLPLFSYLSLTTTSLCRLRGYNQHDAQELVRSLVDNLDEGLKIRCKYDFNPSRILEDDLGESSSSSDEEVPSEENEDARLSRLARAEKRKKARNEARTRKRQKAHSFVSDTFQGTLESVIKCTSCGARSTTHEPFFDLSLELPKTTQLKKVTQYLTCSSCSSDLILTISFDFRLLRSEVKRQLQDLKNQGGLVA